MFRKLGESRRQSCHRIWRAALILRSLQKATLVVAPMGSFVQKLFIANGCTFSFVAVIAFMFPLVAYKQRWNLRSVECSRSKHRSAPDRNFPLPNIIRNQHSLSLSVVKPHRRARFCCVYVYPIDESASPDDVILQYRRRNKTKLLSKMASASGTVPHKSL